MNTRIDEWSVDAFLPSRVCITGDALCSPTGLSLRAGGGGGKGRAAKRQRVYEEHRPMSDITAGIKTGRYHQGTLR